ncbi:MAG: hypothetical protein AAF483_14960 [Planctomycetota bacterium]
MNLRSSTVTIVLLLLCSTCLGQAQRGSSQPLESGEYFITQSWSQETNFKRPYFVRVPKGRAPNEKLPVFIFLHGNGGRAEGAMNGSMRRLSNIAQRYIMVFPDGYERSWNIVSERSKADDKAFMEEIVKQLATYPNVQTDNFSIMGNSNGAALVNQLAIESKLPNIKNYISAVSPLNGFQYDGKNFKIRGKNNEYKKIAEPMPGKRLLNISGTEDPLVPYSGGPSRAIPAKGGKLPFVAAENSTYLWAKQMGYKGKQLSSPTHRIGPLEVFSYLNGAVVHVKVNRQGHGAGGAVRPETLLDFLDGRELFNR